MSETKYKTIKIGLIDLKSHNLFSILQATRNVGYNVSQPGCRLAEERSLLTAS